MDEVQSGAVAPVEPVVNVPATNAVPAPDAPTVQDQANQPPADESVQPTKTYTEEETRKLVNERLTKERRRLERTLRAELRAEMAERQLQELRQPQQQTQKPPGRPKQEDFVGRPFDEYLDAVTEWKLEQREAKRREESEKESRQQRAAEQTQQHASTVQEKVIKAGQDKYPDFDEVVMGEDVHGITEAMVAAATRLPNGADVLYKLGQNTAERMRIARLSDVEQVWELKDLSAKLSAPPKPTNTPPPIVPNNSQARGSKDWKDMSTKEHVETWLKRKR